MRLKLYPHTRIRRVKCDETRPCCKRCQSTGRKCDGYYLVSRSELSLVIPSRIPEADEKSRRSLDFFQHVVAPVLSGPLGRSFWTHLVSQLAHQEPAARNAVITISALYEQFNQGATQLRLPYDEGFAMRHYSSAIQEIISLKAHYPDQLDTTIIVSILLSCIECLRGNKAAAVSHCRHGILLMNSSRPNAELASIFRHLSFVPLFANECLEQLPLLTNGRSPSASTPFQTFAQAQETIDWLGYHAVKLARLRDNYRTSEAGPSTTSNSPIFFSKEIRRLNVYLESWFVSFLPLKEQAETTSKYISTARILEMRWLASKIWTNCFLEDDETAYDAYMDEFERIVEIAEQSPPEEDPFWSKSPKFMFEMGFAPQLYFTTMKCRYLPLRIKALVLMREKCCKREILWDFDAMYTAGKRIIEVEHDMKLPDDLSCVRQMIDDPPPAPTDSHRLRDFTFADSDDVDYIYEIDNGLEFQKNRIYFHFPTSVSVDVD
ncbi:hypothetical protein N7532_009496 [Penicillium argentinense]|uniref:Zn(2)-C6 fungal-type domain-containing protein n=1 Tax=Penicillium argentinense TaxID=1131581 RepID=A0A9W9K3I6_9EURO|nr:uncharacterized protein N7532_009496 [Penicillium argentinense]KAJ5090812.1 hypothetical protein N7532_009496 [Penicillium argentinense]